MNNKGFFVPTIMVYILIFISLILSFFLESVSYEIMLKSYEQEIYFESALLDTKEITKYKFFNKYVNICENKKNNIIKKNYKIEVKQTCFIEYGDNKLNWIYELLNDDLVVDEITFNKIIDIVEKKEFKEKKLFNKVEDAIEKEIITISELWIFYEGIEQYIKGNIFRDVLFNVKITMLNNREEDLLLVYDFEKKICKIIVHQ